MSRKLLQATFSPMVSPVGVLVDGREVRVEADVQCHRTSGVESYEVSISGEGGLEGALAEVRLFEVDLGVKELKVFQEEYYMPSAPRGFRRVVAGEKAPAFKWWGATHGNEFQLLCHPMTVLQLSPGEVVLVGFVTGMRYEAYLLLDTNGATIRLSAFNHLFDRKLRPGEPIKLEELVVIRGESFDEVARAFARRTAAESGSRVPTRTVVGWNDWQYWREEKCEKDVMESLPVLAKLRKRGFPMEHIILDGGWCDHASEWLRPCGKYPSGMKRLSARLRREGFRLGLWFAPYLTNVNTALAREHPEWLVREAGSERPLTRKGSNVGACCMPDYTILEVMEWMRGIVRTFVREWKIGYLKLDGPSLAHYYGGRFRDGALTPIEVIRRTLEVIREECGEEVIVEGEGLFGPSIGLVDTQRISQDNHPFWYNPAGDASLKANIQNELAGTYMHGVYWHNHRENVILRDFLSPHHAFGGDSGIGKDHTLSENELRCHISAAVLGGGAMLITEPMAEFSRSPSRMELITRFLPHFEAGRTRVIDDFSGGGERQPAVYAMKIERRFETWDVVGVFNFEDHYEDFEVDLAKIAGNIPVRLFDYWNEQYLGRHRKKVTIKDVPPHGCKVIAARPARGEPQLLGTNMHVLQGAVDVGEVRWEKGVLHITVTHPNQRERKLFIYCPPGMRVKRIETNAKDYLVDARGLPLLTLHFNGRGGRETRFALTFK